MIGPDLSTIGGKLDRQALLDAIVTPSAAIGFGYETWTMETTTNGTVSGMPSRTRRRVVVLENGCHAGGEADAIRNRVAASDPDLDHAGGPARRDDAAAESSISSAF